MVFDRAAFKSLQGRGGLDISGKGRIRPFVTANWVHEFQTNPIMFDGAFASGLPGPYVTFGLGGQDKDWAEVGGGLSIETGRARISISADTTIGRNDIKNQAYRGSITFKF